MATPFHFAVFAVSALAGAIASVTGFGIGSLLTPLFALKTTTKLAVAIVSVPHLLATFVRFWMLRRHVNRRVLAGFGVMSAVAGLGGALLHARFGAPALTLIFGVILIFAGAMGVTGLSEKLRFGQRTAWVAGGVSGGLGGLVGNQGGIRSAALLSFELDRRAFVATATAIGVIVDGARMPVYFLAESRGILAHGPWLVVGGIGVLLGTFAGMHVLKRIPERAFRKAVSALILALGLFMLLKGFQS